MCYYILDCSNVNRFCKNIFIAHQVIRKYREEKKQKDKDRDAK